jgi:hypothetical protein
MQKGHTANPQPAIFSTVTPKVAAAIEEDTICLHANVFTDPAFKQELRLAMTNYYVAICSPYSQFSEYLYSAELEFALKFEVLF